MSDDANRCPGCGALQPANAPEALCARCLKSQAMTGDTPGPADKGARTAPAATDSGHSPEAPPGDPEANTEKPSPLVGEDTGGGAAAQLTEAERAKLRRQALEWLKAELAVWAKLLKSGPPQAKSFIAQTLKHWQDDTDLAGVRGDKAIEGLPESERAACRMLWADVAAVLEKARGAAQAKSCQATHVASPLTSRYTRFRRIQICMSKRRLVA